VQKLYRDYSEEAERLGVFGAPTYVLNGERFWGQDRLEFLDRALDRLTAA
jgi:2-hydroxychromene-2-carboxylate isomerase